MIGARAMALLPVHQLSAVCTVISFAYVCNSLDRHSLTARPQLSSLIVLFFTGLICLSTSYISKWIPGVDGRFNSAARHSQTGLLTGTNANGSAKETSDCLPPRPKRYFTFGLIACIVARLEILNHVYYKQQCSVSGVESWLCLLLIGYYAIASDVKWSIPGSDDFDDPWRTFVDDFKDWMTGRRAEFCLSIVGIILVSSGAYAAVNQMTRSTYICFTPLDSRSQIISLQYVGVILDAAIVVILWRILMWTGNLKLRLHMLSNVCLISAASIAFVWIVTSTFMGYRHLNPSFGSFYASDVLFDTVAFSILTISTAIWACETSPVISTTLITSFVGIWRAAVNVISLGGWMHLSLSSSLMPLWVTSLGLGVFIYAQEIRCVIFIRRSLFFMLIVLLLITATIFAFVRPLSHFDKRHPMNDLIYEARAIHDRWLVKAATSKSIAIAVTTYEERHGGRAPPPKFGEWYQYASDSTVIDEFQQIDKDLAVFWSLPPETLRKRAKLVTSYAGVGSITVKDGQVTASDLGDEATSLELLELVDMIKKFSRHLPNMILPVNLNRAPRIIPSWADKRLRGQAYLESMAKIISKRSNNDSITITNTLGSRGIGQTDGGQQWHQTWASDFKHLFTEACPSSSLVKTGPHWQFGSFCSACVKPHSRGQLMSDWATSLDTCSQPDLSYLHSFFITDPSLPPIQELVPLFGSFKTTGFSDILVPLSNSRTDEPDHGEPFSKRKDTLFWSSSVGTHALTEQAIRGSHKLRLLHLTGNADIRDRVTMILPVQGSDDMFKSESVSVLEANRDLSFRVGIEDFPACFGKNCDLLKQEYGVNSLVENPLNYRYVLLTDEDDGPPADILKVLRSQSLPFISTIFQTWYSDRLTPWLHFVPVDPRYQALHTTLLYFTGTANKAKMNNINTYIKGRSSDAEWIAQQGQRWASKVLQKKDMEIYLFRLLLEWGRLIDDRRDEIGYQRLASSEYKSDEWSQLSALENQ